MRSLVVVALLAVDVRADPPIGELHEEATREGPSVGVDLSMRMRDKVTAVVSPLRSGEPGGLLSRITLADGRVLLNGPGGATATGGAPAQK